MVFSLSRRVARVSLALDADVVNGERNTLVVSIESKESERNVTLKNIAGSLHHAQTNRLVKNVRTVYLSAPCAHA